MALDVFVAGAHTATYNAVALGLTKQGYEVSSQIKAEMINETDGYGLSTLDWVYRGMNVYVSWINRAWRAGPKGCFTNYGGAMGKISSTALPVGRLASSIAQALVTTAVANTPAATDPATFTAPGAILVPDFDVRWVFDSRLRDLPIRMQCLPYVSGSDVLAFAVT